MINESNFIGQFSVFIIALSALMGVMFYMMSKKSDVRYNEEKKKIELDIMRANLESQIYALNERMGKNSKQWAAINHLQIDGNNSGNIKKPSLTINDFLEASGMTEDDIIEKDYVFVLTPFHDNQDETYLAIKNICAKSNIICIRGDEQNFKSDIFSHVLRNILGAKIIIANLNGRNPNVMYELGIAHALDKNVIIVSKLLDDLPVDIKSKQIIAYKNVSELSERLLVELLKISNKYS